jgi:hypothetical protein
VPLHRAIDGFGSRCLLVGSASILYLEAVSIFLLECHRCITRTTRACSIRPSNCFESGFIQRQKGIAGLGNVHAVWQISPASHTRTSTIQSSALQDGREGIEQTHHPPMQGDQIRFSSDRCCRLIVFFCTQLYSQLVKFIRQPFVM